MKLLNFHVSTSFYEMCCVGLLVEVQHRQYVVFHMKHVIQDKTMGLALVAWMGGWEMVEVFSTWVISDEPGDSMLNICTLSEIWISYETITPS